jgi:hypothetical protein
LLGHVAKKAAQIFQKEVYKQRSHPQSHIEVVDELTRAPGQTGERMPRDKRNSHQDRPHASRVMVCSSSLYGDGKNAGLEFGYAALVLRN